MNPGVHIGSELYQAERPTEQQILEEIGPELIERIKERIPKGSRLVKIPLSNDEVVFAGHIGPYRVVCLYYDDWFSVQEGFYIRADVKYRTQKKGAAA